MRQEEQEKLRSTAEENGYLSIGINRDGEPVRSGSVPWERTVSAFNMKTPKITLAAEDLDNEEIMSLLKKCHVNGCYIMTALNDYSFLSDFGEIRDLFIRHGGQLKDLSFMKDMKELFIFYLEDAALPDLKPLIDCCNSAGELPGKCFGFRNCRIEDTSALQEIAFTVSELLVWPCAGDSAERWKTSRRPGVFRYYE